MKQSIFAEEWRRCLEAHYMDVIRRGDQVAQQSLVPLLSRFGFRESDLREMYIRATMRQDDLPPDFTLNPAALAPAPLQPATFTPHPAECTCPACMEKVDLLRHDEEGQPLSAEEAFEKRARLAHEDDTPPPPPDAPIQLSLFQ
ncbi:hypothetical protein VZO05_09690 [Aggregatilineales bacterium SYSU G02658]